MVSNIQKQKNMILNYHKPNTCVFNILQFREITAIACKMGHSCSAVPFELCNLIKQDYVYLYLFILHDK